VIHTNPNLCLIKKDIKKETRGAHSAEFTLITKETDAPVAVVVLEQGQERKPEKSYNFFNKFLAKIVIFVVIGAFLVGFFTG